MKKYRIVSKIRFSIFIIILAMAIVASVAFITGSTASGESIPQYYTVEVQAGDTLWDIAERYCDKGTDIREVIYEIREANNLSPEDIEPGDSIKIPKHC